jgi:hypothetical protein
VCWNAGTTCSGGPGTYTDCEPADLDVFGNLVAPATAQDDAVLRPMSRYFARLEGLGRPVTVAALSGVPEGYPAADIVYADSVDGTANDPNYQANFGIGPGCVSASAEAVPPVRLRALAERFAVGDPLLYSICALDYGISLSQIATLALGE